MITNLTKVSLWLTGGARIRTWVLWLLVLCWFTRQRPLQNWLSSLQEGSLQEKFVRKADSLRTPKVSWASQCTVPIRKYLRFPLTNTGIAKYNLQWCSTNIIFVVLLFWRELWLPSVWFLCLSGAQVLSVGVASSRCMDRSQCFISSYQRAWITPQSQPLLLPLTCKPQEPVLTELLLQN